MDTMNITSYAGIEILSARFKQYRIDYPLTQKELAEKSGVSIRSIQNFEAGKDIQLSNFIKLLRALDLARNLEMLIPDVTIRPSAYLEQTKEKQRVRKKKDSQMSGDAPFVWGDES